MVEYARVFVPEPVATHMVPFDATPFPCVLKMEVPLPVHVIPSVEYARVFVPEPVATIIGEGNVIRWGRAELKEIPVAIFEPYPIPIPIQLIPL